MEEPVEKGSVLRITGLAILSVSGLLTFSNFNAASHLAGLQNLPYLINILVFALPLGVLGLLLFAVGTSQRRKYSESREGQRTKNIRPLV